MKTINSYMGVFSPFLYDAAIHHIGRTDGIYLLASTGIASYVKEVASNIPRPVPFVFDRRMSVTRIEFHEGTTGDLLVEIVGLPIPSHIEEQCEQTVS